MLSDACERLLLEHKIDTKKTTTTTTTHDGKKPTEAKPPAWGAKKCKDHASKVGYYRDKKSTNDIDDNARVFATRRINIERDEGTRTTRPRLRWRGDGGGTTKEILAFPRGKTTMSSHAGREKLENNGNVSGGGPGRSSGNHNKKTSFQPRAPAMTRERRADVARRGARGACFGKRIEKGVADVTVRQVRGISTDGVVEGVWRFVPAFAGSAQQDAHEFMRFALERLRKELLVGERMMKKRKENERLKREYEQNALMEIGFDEDEKHSGRRRNGEDGDYETVLPGKVEESEVVPTEKNELEFNSHAERK